MSNMKPLIDLKLSDPDIFRNKAYVNGQWIEAKSGRRFNVADPGTNQPFATCSDMSTEDVNGAVEAAAEAFATYRTFTPLMRSMLLSKWESLVRENKEDISRILVYETGKPLTEARFELDATLVFIRWFVGEAERIHGTTARSAMPGCRTFTIKQPIGVSVALVPWNFPISMAARKISAAFAAGCTSVTKPSPQTPFTTLALAYLAEKAGFPKGVFNVLPTSVENTPALAEVLCKHPTVKKISFTGSTRVGKILAAYCAENLKKLTLELGGNCPCLVFDDANLDRACEHIMATKFMHAGQACIAPNRVYVQRGVYDKVAAMLAEATRKIRVGHGLDEGVTMGALTLPAGLEKVVGQIEDAKKHGGIVVTGGNRVNIGKGYFLEPTLIKNATKSMRVASEETFGPLLALFPFDTEEEAVQAANDTSMGLSSYCFTKDINRMWRLLENLEAGMIAMNSKYSASLESPFGGIKASGYGKESGLEVGVDEYLITKTGMLALEGQY
ncbi:aldehyde dehydrogenase [Xylaria intraflava]|nr:aldehyde dehydrogenase [Xylaria intraflava]